MENILLVIADNPVWVTIWLLIVLMSTVFVAATVSDYLDRTRGED
jgi:hypothetical protein